MRLKSFLILCAILLVATASAFFVYPQGFGDTARPWRLGLDLVGGSHLVYDIDLSSIATTEREDVVNGLRDVIENRVNLFGVSEPTVVVAQSGDDYRLVVELAGIKDVSTAIEEIGATPYLHFAEVTLPPEGTVADPEDPTSGIQFTPTNLNGRYLERAQLNFTQLNEPEVLLQFNSEGAQLFEDLTAKNIGNYIAVFLDDAPITIPIVNQTITGGTAVITGNFTLDEARALVERFNAGALPAPITLVSQNTVNASLGADTLQKIIVAGLWGTLAVAIFMLLYYRMLGLYAAIALVVYVVVTLAIFKLFGMTMTVAGIAGFLLSIGMAVDANILIFERSKEELRKGIPRATALEEGFARAWTSIRDSNLTTIITAVILYYFTASFVRGFALTLLVGVLVSMFSAITVTRTMLRVFTRN